MGNAKSKQGPQAAKAKQEPIDFKCPRCSKRFETDRGRKIHISHAHKPKPILPAQSTPKSDEISRVNDAQKPPRKSFKDLKGIISPFGLIMYSSLAVCFLFGALYLVSQPIAQYMIEGLAAFFVLMFAYEGFKAYFSRPKKEKVSIPIEELSKPLEKYSKSESVRRNPSNESLVNDISTSITDSLNIKKEKKIKEPKAQRTKFFSEEHPGAFGLAKSILPRIHIIALVGWIIYSMYWELISGNSDFILDWFNASPIPGMIQVMSSKEAFMLWFKEYGTIFIMMASIVILILVALYYTIYRFAFKDYYKFSEGSRRYEGRCYWRTNNSLTKWFDKRYGSPPRMQNIYWLKIGWWPPINLINPSNSLIRLDTTLDEKCESKGIYAISVSEKPLRRKVGNEPKHWTSYGGQYVNGDIPNKMAEDYFTLRSKVLVDDTTDLSFGNADTRNSVMLDGLRLSKPSIRRFIVDDRKRKQDHS